MTEMTTNYAGTGSYADAPAHFGKCVATGCAAAGQCLRHLVAQAVMERDELMLVVSPAHARPADGTACPHFLGTGPVRMARGFRRALGTLRADSVKAAVSELTALHSQRTYYRMLNGEAALDADRQQQVADILARHGAEVPVVFDHYDEVMPW